MKTARALSPTNLAHGPCDRGAKRGVAVRHGNAPPDFGDVAVEAPRHGAAAQEFDAMPFASAVSAMMFALCAARQTHLQDAVAC
ncbi:MAG: hypothetical protein CFE33_17985 [Pseudorhodobacter sp. PARRP1]|nr:MAG: hypothetical protein CFE33_17985 [Pseudorhodobacter sp. PARRP1]